MHVSARFVTVDHRVAIRAHDCKIGESRCAGFIRLREWMKVMYVCITGSEFSINACKVKATTWYLADDATVTPQGIRDLRAPQFPLTLAMCRHAAPLFALEPNQFVCGRKVGLYWQRPVPCALFPEVKDGLVQLIGDDVS